MALGSHYYRLPQKSILQWNMAPSLKDFQSKPENEKYCEQNLRICLYPLAKILTEFLAWFSLFFFNKKQDFLLYEKTQIY